MRLLLFLLVILPISAQNLEQKLANDKVDWNFAEIPFREAVDLIRNTHKVNIVLSRGTMIEMAEKVHFRLRDVTLGNALHLFCQMHNLAYVVKHDVVVFHHVEHHNFDFLPGKVQTKIYDLQSLLKSQQSQSRFLHLRGNILLPYNEDELHHLSKQIHDWDTPFAEFVQACIAPNYWDHDELSIDMRNDKMIVVQLSRIQRQIAQFLEELQQHVSRKIDVRLWQFVLANSDIHQWQLHQQGSISDELFARIQRKVLPHDIRLQTKFTMANNSLFPVYDSTNKQHNHYHLYAFIFDKEHVWAQTLHVMQQKLHEKKNATISSFYNMRSGFLLRKDTIIPMVIAPLTQQRSLVTFIHVQTDGKPVYRTQKAPNIPREQVEIRQKLRDTRVSVNFRNATIHDVTQFLSEKTQVNFVHKAFVGYEAVNKDKDDYYNDDNYYDDYYEDDDYEYDSEDDKYEEESSDYNEDVFKEDPKDVEKASTQDREHQIQPKFEWRKKRNINLYLNDVSSENLLQLLCKIHHLDYNIVPGAVVLSENEYRDFQRPTSMKIYDTSNLSLLHFDPPTNTTKDLPAAFNEGFIKTLIDKNSWDDNGTNTEGWRHLLVVNQTPEVHWKINNFLAALPQNIAKIYQRVNVCISVGKEKTDAQKMCFFTTSNGRQVVLKCGELVMGQTPSHLELRKDIVYGHTLEKMSDLVAQRKSWEIMATPLIRGNTIDMEVKWTLRDKDTFKRHFNTTVKNGETVLVMSLTSGLNLYVRAWVVK